MAGKKPKRVKEIVKHGLAMTGFTEPWVVDLYKGLYKSLRAYYKVTIKPWNPLFDILLEKIAYVTAKLKYAENYREDANDNPNYADLYSKHIGLLIRCVDQLMKYTESTKKVSRVDRTEKIIKEVKDASTDKLKDRLAEIVGGKEDRTEMYLGRAYKEED